MLEKLGKFMGPALQQLLDIFDLPTPSRGTKVGQTHSCTCIDRGKAQ